MRSLIVGAGGYVGSRLATHLEAQGVVVVRSSSRDNTGVRPETGLLPADFAVEPGIDVVVYLATSPLHREGSRGAPHLYAVNVISAVMCAEAARRAGVRRFIYTSTGNVYSPSFVPMTENAALRRDDWYPLSKLQAEEALALFRPSMDVLLPRLFGVYGPGQRGRLISNLISSVVAGRPIRLSAKPTAPKDLDGLCLSLGYIDDVVAVLSRLVVEGGCEVMNVTGPEVVSLRDIAATIGDHLNRPPVFDASATLRDFDLIADITLLEKSFAPRFTRFADGIQRMLADYARPPD